MFLQGTQSSVVRFTELSNWCALHDRTQNIELLILCNNLPSIVRFLRMYNNSSLSLSIWIFCRSYLTDIVHTLLVRISIKNSTSDSQQQGGYRFK
jgi:hypothetical protein